ncbi:MAG: DUF4411 family protein [Candidatus Thermoplasmatota archaeon]|nr:DUF4411 family protein [Candidatus Thermoplasmatota archaeon]
MWQDIEDLIKEGTIRSPQEVYDELSIKDDDIFSWAKKHSELFIEMDQNQIDEVFSLMAKYPNMIDPSKTRTDADPFVIALAKNTNATVVTYETQVGMNAKRIKIPNVCVLEGIRYIDPLAFLRELKLLY